VAILNQNSLTRKSFWVGVGVIASGIGMCFVHATLNTGIQTIIGGLATIFVTDEMANTAAKSLANRDEKQVELKNVLSVQTAVLATKIDEAAVATIDAGKKE
jgi:hypothetical protein